MTDAKLYALGGCRKGRIYAHLLRSRGIEFDFCDIEVSPNAAAELRKLFNDGNLKSPTLVIGGKKLRNPSERELDRVLAREGLYDPGIVHEAECARFVRYMKPSDAFVAYSRSGDRLTLTHIEVPSEARGSGFGTLLALDVFPLVKDLGLTARITCPFMRRIAAGVPAWAEYFNIRGADQLRRQTSLEGA